jgi:hypothetical protein
MSLSGIFFYQKQLKIIKIINKKYKLFVTLKLRVNVDPVFKNIADAFPFIEFKPAG